MRDRADGQTRAATTLGQHCPQMTLRRCSLCLPAHCKVYVEGGRCKKVSESVIELRLARKLPLKMEKFVSTDGCGGAENGFRNAAAPKRETEMKGKSHYGVRYSHR